MRVGFIRLQTPCTLRDVPGSAEPETTRAKLRIGEQFRFITLLRSPSHSCSTTQPRGGAWPPLNQNVSGTCWALMSSAATDWIAKRACVCKFCRVFHGRAYHQVPPHSRSAQAGLTLHTHGTLQVKNRESAARSRLRKQAYTSELEAQVCAHCFCMSCLMRPGPSPCTRQGYNFKLLCMSSDRAASPRMLLHALLLFTPLLPRPCRPSWWSVS